MDSYKMEERENGVLLFTITREEKRNAVNYEVMEGLEKAIRLAHEPNIRALVITGTGEKAFCSGGDLSVFHELRTEEQAYQMLSKMGENLFNLAMLPKPSIALINGIAVGGGCEIAAACDFRIARKGISAGFIQGNLAITTGWGGGTLLLERLPVSNGMKMLVEARKYTVDELIELGFIQYIYEGAPSEGLRAAMETTFLLEGDVLGAYKEMLIQKWEMSKLKERIENEIRNCAILWASEAHHKQVEKFLGN
ncbi:enoyl-CoA hydratase/isomerase family protein [Robertmurraya kyonggiensis]|uniref:Enoyl-CoA hydratase/isomerase family protein n=1 Tax=Robertmurraya kyonggiensis TaxID=1037680 RepID=A0A4U1D7J1_9BACI|nr:enoyl-CoA hydratase/isomerase family protein [Robertmurraya kyonggiensis]TKC18559.1 enoyl-CoA hydratase/isomerase family protein [Robertmurraya kyonggiensis]